MDLKVYSQITIIMIIHSIVVSSEHNHYMYVITI